MRELVGLSQASGPQRFENLQQYLLHQVVSGRGRSQVAKAVESNPRPHPSTHLLFGFTIAPGNPGHEVRVGESDIHRSPF